MKFFTREATYDRLLTISRVRADSIMLWMNVFLCGVCFAVFPINSTLISVLGIGVPTLLVAWLLRRHYPGQLKTRLFMSCAFMIYTGLLIHQLNGDIEAHFAAFGLIGVLLFYRDWRCIVAATVFIYLHHLVLGLAQSHGMGVYVFDDPRFWLTFAQHVAYFLPFVGMMGYLSIWLRVDASEKVEVIELTQSIAENQFIDTKSEYSTANPLVNSVVNMKHQLQDLIRVLPVPLAIIRLHDSRLMTCNAEWSAKFRIDNDNNFGHQSMWKSENEWSDINEELAGSLTGSLKHFETELTDIEGRVRYCELSLLRSKQANGDVAILVVQDITDHREKEVRIRKLAYQDLLTDLPNRAALIEALDEAMALCVSGKQAFAIGMVDLDEFKPVNDIYGHDAGDQVLRILGGRLAENTPSPHLVGRMGGDEFVLVFRDTEQSDTITPIVKNCLAALQQPVKINDGVYVKLSGSMGVVHIPPYSCMDITDALRVADSALYQAKAEGKSCWKLSEVVDNAVQQEPSDPSQSVNPLRKSA